MAEEIPFDLNKFLKQAEPISSSTQTEVVTTIQDMIDLIEGNCLSQGQEVTGKDPDNSDWRPKIGPEFNAQEYMRSFYEYLLREDGTY